MTATIYQTERPRNVNAFQAAALLYGDWGTSKIYVIGLAFALAYTSSVWLIAGVSLLSLFVGLNYILICKYYPNGGGVYASVRHRSEIMALLGGFFLICDYIITAALSALSAFYYLGVTYPEWSAIATIVGIGILNFLGPRHTGTLALFIAICSVVVVFILGIFSVFHLETAVARTTTLHDGLKLDWVHFVTVIVALSGVESIANMTGVMKLDPGSTQENPSVVKTAAPALLAVMIEVALFTTLFSLAINALPDLKIVGNEVLTHDQIDVRDYMLKYMGEVFCGQLLSPAVCKMFGFVVGIVFSVLLLSAVNTAIVAFNSLIFVMARDGQFPQIFTKINRFGVPILPLIFSVIAPIFVLLFVHDIEKLAQLYAIGFVGAMTVNLGSTSTDSSLDLKWRERLFMFSTFLVLLAIEVTLFIEKVHARAFVMAVITIGLVLRGIVQEQKRKRKDLRLSHVTHASSRVLEHYIQTEEQKERLLRPAKETYYEDHVHSGAILCAVTHVGKTLEFAIQESVNTKQKLYILFIREQMVREGSLNQGHWIEDDEACKLFDAALSSLEPPNFAFIYNISDLPHVNVLYHAKTLKVSRVIMGMPRTNRLLQIIRGDVVSEVYRSLPKNIDLIVIS